MRHPFLKLILPLFVCYLGIQVYYFLIYTPQGYIQPLTWDKFGYYLYLPSYFIHHDLLHLRFAEAAMRQYNLCDSFYQAHLVHNGNYVLSYTLGLAVLEFPFFCLGHLMAYLLGYPMDGFSMPYQFCITLCGTFYAMIGIYFTYRNLRFFFSERLTLTLLAVLIGCTNYFYYSVFENGMTHSYLFTLYAAVIYWTIRWHQEQKVKFIIWLGIVIGFAIIIRPSEILIVLIPLLWNITDKTSLIDKWRKVTQNDIQIVLMIGITSSIGLIQLAYWKFSSGSWFYNSYKETGQYFDFLHPHLLHGIFSIQKGWLVYTPVMILSFVGLLFLYQRARNIFWAVFICAALNIYVIFSWWMWSYGGGFGARAMVGSYALLLIPMGYAIDYVFSKRILKWFGIIFIAFCAMLNVSQTIQYAKGMISPGGLNAHVYSLLFGKLSIDLNDLKAYEGLMKIDYSKYVEDTIYDHSLHGGSQFVMKEPITLTVDDVLIYSGPLKKVNSAFIRIATKGKFDSICYTYNKGPMIRVTFEDSAHNEIVNKQIHIEGLIWDASRPLNSGYVGEPNKWHKLDMIIEKPERAAYVRIEGEAKCANNTMIDSMVVMQLYRQ